MLRRTLFDVLRQEQQELMSTIAAEERKARPDRIKLATLRQQVRDLRTEMEQFPEAYENAA